MITIRPATLDDLGAILDIYNDAVLTTTATYDYEPRSMDHRVAWYEDHLRNGYPIFVAVDGNGNVIGWSSLSRFHDRMGYRFTSENSIYVAATHRGQGIGKQLLEPLIASAKEKKLRAIIAVIDADNAASIKLHEKYGFEHVGRFKKVGYKFNRWLDVAYMELLLY
jgi:L-amino acid N-acyltransferase YncA